MEGMDGVLCLCYCTVLVGMAVLRGKTRQVAGEDGKYTCDWNRRYACRIDLVSAFGWSIVDLGRTDTGTVLSFSGSCLHGESERRCM
jgi:hypothetical protein